jgi:hypothetical protein
MRNRICTLRNPITHAQSASDRLASPKPSGKMPIGERQLVEKLRLENLPSNRPEEAVCFLCDEFFEPAGTVAILYEGEMPMGYLCADCATDPPAGAAKVHRRVKRIQSLLRYKVDDDSAEHRMRRLQLILRRAAYWKTLATRLEKLDSWD